MDMGKKPQDESLNSVKELLHSTLSSLDEAMADIKKTTDKTAPVDLKSINSALKKTEEQGEEVADEKDKGKTAVFDRPSLSAEPKTPQKAPAEEKSGDEKTADAIYETIRDNMAQDRKPSGVTEAAEQPTITPAENAPEATSTETDSPKSSSSESSTSESHSPESDPAESDAKGGKKKLKEHKKFFHWFNSIVMIALFAAITVSLVILKRPSGFMESENRNYATFPEFSLASYRTGDFTSDINTWYTDTTPYREELKTVANRFTDLFGLKLGNNVIKSAGGTVEKEEFDEKTTITTATAYIPGADTDETQTTVETAATESAE